MCDAFDLPDELGRWLLSCPRGDGLLLARGNRIPIRIEATAEEKDVVDWRPVGHGKLTDAGRSQDRPERRCER